MNQEEENVKKKVCHSERPERLRRPAPDEPYRKIQQHSEKQQLKQTQNEKLRRRRCRQPYLLLLFPKVILRYIGKQVFNCSIIYAYRICWSNRKVFMILSGNPASTVLPLSLSLPLFVAGALYPLPIYLIFYMRSLHIDKHRLYKTKFSNKCTNITWIQTMLA